jgi:hypothetical protein
MSPVAIALLLLAIGHIWTVIVCFQTGMLWGLGSLFVPFVGWIFCVLNIREMWKPLLISLAGAVLLTSQGGLTP